MRLSIGDTAKLCGISVRTLHYYDEIGLVKPSEVTEAGYRFYDSAALRTLQRVLFYREIELSLGEIACILQHPEYDGTQALIHHRELLLLKRRHIDGLLRLVDETIEGGRDMKKPEVPLTDIQAAREKYAAEARERWGNTEAYRQYKKSAEGRTEEEKAEAMREAEGIFTAFADARSSDPAGAEAQALVMRWQEHITKHYYTCTKAILASLGEMYVSDGRFCENIDRCGDGTARFMRDAIRVYCAE